jgi:hypothetical protein
VTIVEIVTQVLIRYADTGRSGWRVICPLELPLPMLTRKIMHLKTLSRSVLSVAVVSSLYACGGGGSSLTSTSTSDLDNSAAQSPVTEVPSSSSPSSSNESTLVGRVADGYIRGATVCLDINENGSCDADEPTAVTGEGGLYTLAMVEGAEGKPILADVPATAIDEDDFQPIGKRMMLSAPPSKREFISPITTLVQQELENNPAIDLDEAEASVKQELGFSIEDEEASLFTDYVANGDDADSGDKAERFRHMHRTAQVVAKMMQEIQDAAEDAVTEQGVDLEGDPAARKALNKAVRKEIRKLLPEIAEAVSERIVEVREQAAAEADASAADESFDAGQLAEQFIPSESIDADEIIIEKDLPRVEQVTVETMLTEGFYWFDVNCSVSEAYDSGVAVQDGTVQDSVDTTIGAGALPPFECAAGYTHIVLGDDGEHINQIDYEYDSDQGVWVAHEDFSDENRDNDVWHLVDGEWATVNDSADATVEFTDNGGAIINHGDGEMVIKAVQRSLTGQHVARHLNDFDFHGGAASDSLFPADSSEYLFKIKRKDSQYALFNWGDDGDCAEHNGNCNIVNQVTDDGLQAVESLDAVSGGIVLDGLLHDELDRRLSVVLHEGQEEGWSKAEWIVNNDAPVDRPFEEIPVCEPFDGELAPDGVTVKDNPNIAPDVQELVDGDLLTDTHRTVESELKLVQLLDDEAIEDIPPSIEYVKCAAPSDLVFNDADADADVVFDGDVNFDGDPDVDADGIVDLPDGIDVDFATDNALESETGAVTKPGNSRGHSFGRWRTVEVDGVKMIELTLPFALRHNIDFDDTASVMLIEHEGFVRRGAHFSNRSVETETAYNPVAFDALLSELEQRISNQLSALR